MSVDESRADAKKFIDLVEAAMAGVGSMDDMKWILVEYRSGIGAFVSFAPAIPPSTDSYSVLAAIAIP